MAWTASSGTTLLAIVNLPLFESLKCLQQRSIRFGWVIEQVNDHRGVIFREMDGFFLLYDLFSLFQSRLNHKLIQGRACQFRSFLQLERDRLRDAVGDPVAVFPYIHDDDLSCRNGILQAFSV